MIMNTLLIRASLAYEAIKCKIEDACAVTTVD